MQGRRLSHAADTAAGCQAELGTRCQTTDLDAHKVEATKTAAAQTAAQAAALVAHKVEPTNTAAGYAHKVEATKTAAAQTAAP